MATVPHRFTPVPPTPRVVPFTLISEEEYLALDLAAEHKLEYYDGQVVAMAGASVAHNFITDNTLGTLLNMLRGSGCRPVGSDLRVHTEQGNRYFYPDLTVICGERRYKPGSKPASLLNPTMIVEVLSDSTEKVDRGRKLRFYQAIPGLRYYLLLDAQQIGADLYSREASALTWTYCAYDHLTDTLPLPALGIALPLADVYAAVVFGEGEDDGSAPAA